MNDLDERVKIDQMFDRLEGKYPIENIAQFSKMRKEFRKQANLMQSIWGEKGVEAAEYLVASLFVLCPDDKLIKKVEEFIPGSKVEHS